MTTRDITANAKTHRRLVTLRTAIVSVCAFGWYLIVLAWLDGAARQFGHAWRERAR